MTKKEFRKTKDYQEVYNKIKAYPEGHEFTLYCNRIPKKAWNLLMIIINDCEKDGIVEDVRFDMNMNLDIVSYTYKRI